MIAMPVCEPHLYDKWDSERKIKVMRMAARVNYPSLYYSLPQFYTVISGGRKQNLERLYLVIHLH